jgi:4-amino-4-deoxy-L-arabinose transferase-like glycosyltransferase
MAQLRRVPRAGWMCFAIALVNCAIWTVVVPPFQVPDEISHFAYAQYVAQTGALPPQKPGTLQYSPQEYTALDGLYFFDTIGRPRMRGVFTGAEDRALRSALAQHPSPVGPGGSTSITNQPPLYYALEAIPYLLSPSADILWRLELMRLLSALMAACTVLLVFLFLRELLPRTPWAWTVGALVVAFQPTFCFIAAGVQGDNLLFLAATATFLALLRAWRHGLTLRRGAIVGAAVMAGVLGKLTFIALLPGIALALALLGWREARRRGSAKALAPVALALALVLAPVGIYAVLNVHVWHRGGLTAGGLAVASVNTAASGQAVTLHDTLDYTWEDFLPRLWFMHHNYFPNYPLWNTWLDGSIGHFGWLDYTFPAWVYEWAKYVFWALGALALVGIVRLRGTLRPAAPLLGCFAAMALGLLGAIGYAGIRYRLANGVPFEQARYLFPLLAFYGLFVVLAANAPPRRWAPLLGALLVVLAMAHGLFAETLTISRYYG